MDGAVMQSFYDLAEERSTSIAAASLLVDKLQTTAKDNLGYSWKRLVKGMSSNRKNARQGFAVALTEILLQFPDVDVKEVYALCKETNLPSGHVSQKEIRDLYSGFVFCVSALQRSNRLEDNELCIEVLKDLLQILLKNKLTIKDVVFKVFIDVLDTIKLENMDKVFEAFSEELKKGWTQCSPERLALMSYLEKKDATNAGKIIKKHWNFSHLHHPHNYENIAAVLKGIHCEERAKPQLSIILDSCTSSSHFKIKKASKHFFSVMEAGENKNTVIFTMVHFLNCLPDDKVGSFVCKHMAEHLKKAHPSSPDCITYMTDSVSARISKVESSEAKVSIARSFLALSPRRASCFHEILDSLFGNCPSDVVDDCVSLLESSFITSNNDASSKITTEFRSDCLSWVMNIIRHSSPKVVYQVTKFLFIYSYFEVKAECVEFPQVKPAEPKLSPATIEICKARFNSCLKLLSIQIADVKSKRKGTAEDGRYWVYHLMSSSLVLFTNEQFPMLCDITGFEEWTSLWSVIDEIEAKSPESRSNEDWAFELLFLHAGILFFDEQEQAKVVLNDVFQCYEKHKTGSTENWKSILVDLLISILSYESLMLRNMANECFKMVCHDLDSESIQLVMTALESSDKDDDDEEMEDDSESDESEGDDNEESSDEEEIEEDEEDDEEDEESDMEADDENQEPVVEKADDEADDDINLSDADEEELNEVDKTLGAAIKFAINLKKDKKNEKKQKALKKVKMVQFKVKILDFIEIIVKDIGFSSATMNILPRLLQLVASPSVTSVPVCNKVLGIFKNMFVMKSDKLTVNFEDSLKTDVPAIQEFISKTANRKAQQLAIKTLFMLCKVHLNASEQPTKKKRKVSKNVTPIADTIYSVFSPMLNDFFTNKNTKQDKNIFFQIIERFPIVRPNFVQDVTTFINQDITIYAKMQAIILLQRVLSFADTSVHSSQDEILGALSSLLTKILENEKPSPHHIRECLKLCLKLHAVSTKLELTINPLNSDVRNVIESVGMSQIAGKFPDLPTLSRKVLSCYD
ncbi:myb-binding protein 1A-like protein [Bolinopsis microptera]|uniref:myb-binding protein 1A-like protein n=1 Tax=Bolinopsis microptera TaxID=2820187 RepID=UPI003079D33E